MTKFNYVNLGVVATHMMAARIAHRAIMTNPYVKRSPEAIAQHKEFMRISIEKMHLARTQSGIYNPGDFRTAVLP